MARLDTTITLKPTTSDKRPEQLLNQCSVSGFTAEFDQMQAIQLGEDSVILVPEAYLDSPDDSSDAEWRDEPRASDCWKTTVINEQIDEAHPHMVS